MIDSSATTSFVELPSANAYLDSLAATRPYSYANAEAAPRATDTSSTWLEDLFASTTDVLFSDQVLIWVCLGVIVLAAYLVATRLGIGIPLFRKNAEVSVLSAEEAPEEENDLDRLAAIYESQGDYRQALRHRFLIVLTLLHNSGAIRWRRNGTNSDYVHQLSGHGISEAFRQAVRAFEQGWYGMHPLSVTDYEHACASMNIVRSAILSGRRS
jgi:hypothetical protein